MQDYMHICLIWDHKDAPSQTDLTPVHGKGRQFWRPMFLAAPELDNP